MSDTPNGPDWWLGTDGKWYPPVAPAQPGDGSNGPSSPADGASVGGASSGNRRRGLVLAVAAIAAVQWSLRSSWS